MKMTGFPWFTFPGGGFTTVSDYHIMSACRANVPNAGFVKIYGPDGSQLAKSVDPGVEAIVYADISLDKIDEVKLVADIMGN